MCNPAAVVAMMVVSTALTAYGQYQQGQAQEAAGKAQSDALTYNAAIARNNQILANRAAEDATQRGEIAARQKQIEAAQLKGRQLTVLAANGVDVNQGSSVDILADTAELGKFEELTIKANAAREALGYRQQAQGFETDAVLGTAGASNALSAGSFAKSNSMIQAGGTIAGGLSSVAGKWYQYSKVS